MKGSGAFRTVALTVSPVIFTGLVTGYLTRPGAPGQRSYPPELAAMVQAGIGNQAPCPSGYSMIPEAVEAGAAFIQYRSGATLSAEVKQRLVAVEQATTQGEVNDEVRLTRQEVKDVLTAMLMNRVNSITDAEIDFMADHRFRVLPDHKTPQLVDQVQLRGSKGYLDPTTFKQMARVFRDGSSVEGIILRSMGVGEVRAEIEGFCDVLAHSCPDQWNVMYYSPYQVFMLGYALTSDDQLVDSYNDLHQEMKRIEEYMYKHYGIIVPSSGRFPFGDNGYKYSSPLSTFFNNDVQLELLNRYCAVRLRNCP
jgi:hypothetical protein